PGPNVSLGTLSKGPGMSSMTLSMGGDVASA
ncbi:hypothetical protein X975_09175, partial [Stegodyphus mimosarum]